MDADYASAASEADDEATLEEEDALAAQDGLDQKACSLPGRSYSQDASTRFLHIRSQHMPLFTFWVGCEVYKIHARA